MAAPRALGIGPDPHRAPSRDLLRAYLAGAAIDLPSLLLAPRLGGPFVRRLARRRLAAIAAHARARCPHYREAFAGVDLDALARDGDASRLPLLDKPTLRDHGERLIADGVDRARLMGRSSSGSSGVPTRTYFDPLRELPRRLQELRMLFAHGFTLRDRQLVFDHPGHLTDRPFWPQRLGLWRRVPYPWQVPTEEGIAFLRRERFEVLHGVLSSLRLLALATRAAGGLGYAPRLLVSKGELVDEATRSLCESAFGAPLLDCYTTEEVGIVAWQEPGARRLRVDADLVHVEIVDPDGRSVPPGEVGEVVVTNLYQRAMPIVRYRTGDLAALDPERERSGGLPALTSLSGRALDCVVTPDGEAHHPFALLGPLEDEPALLAYRVAQRARDHVEVLVQVDPALGAGARVNLERRVVGRLGERLGPRVRVTVTDFEPDEALARKSPLVRGLGLSIEELAELGVRL